MGWRVRGITMEAAIRPGGGSGVLGRTASGVLDPTFDGDGKAITDIGGTDTAWGLAIQPDGKIVAAGQRSTSGLPDDAIALVRYHDAVRLYVQQDANFNVTAVTDSAGVVLERYVYEPYGSFTVHNADWSADEDGQSDCGQTHLHQGGRYDAASGTYHFQRRDYSPSLGRWVQPDHIMQYVDGMSLYEYVGGNPSVRMDPLGESWLDAFFGTVAHALVSVGYIERNPADNPSNIYINRWISTIVRKHGTGLPLWLVGLGDLKPDIVNVNPGKMHIYEIKHATIPAASTLAHSEARLYRFILRRGGVCVELGPSSAAGASGSIPSVIEWWSPRDGVILYRWTLPDPPSPPIFVPVPSPNPGPAPNPGPQPRVAPITRNPKPAPPQRPPAPPVVVPQPVRPPTRVPWWSRVGDLLLRFPVILPIIPDFFLPPEDGYGDRRPMA